MNVNNTSNREPAASRIDTSLRDTRHAAASWNVFAKSEIKWKQNGNKQPLSCAPGAPQVAPGVAVFCFVSPFARRSRWRVPPLHSTQAELKAQGPNFVSKWKQVRYNEGPQASNVSHLIAITSMTYRCNGTNLRKPLGVFSECAAPCVDQPRPGMPHKFVHNSTIRQSLKGPRSG